MRWGTAAGVGSGAQQQQQQPSRSLDELEIQNPSCNAGVNLRVDLLALMGVSPEAQRSIDAAQLRELHAQGRCKRVCRQGHAQQPSDERGWRCGVRGCGVRRLSSASGVCE